MIADELRAVAPVLAEVARTGATVQQVDELLGICWKQARAVQNDVDGAEISYESWQLLRQASDRFDEIAPDAVDEVFSDRKFWRLILQLTQQLEFDLEV